MIDESNLPERKTLTADPRAIANEANVLADFLTNRNLLNAHYVVKRDDRIAELEAGERAYIKEIERLNLEVAEAQIALQSERSNAVLTAEVRPKRHIRKGSVDGR